MTKSEKDKKVEIYRVTTENNIICDIHVKKSHLLIFFSSLSSCITSILFFSMELSFKPSVVVGFRIVWGLPLSITPR